MQDDPKNKLAANIRTVEPWNMPLSATEELVYTIRVQWAALHLLQAMNIKIFPIPVLSWLEQEAFRQRLERIDYNKLVELSAYLSRATQPPSMDILDDWNKIGFLEHLPRRSERSLFLKELEGVVRYFGLANPLQDFYIKMEQYNEVKALE